MHPPCKKPAGSHAFNPRMFTALPVAVVLSGLALAPEAAATPLDDFAIRVGGLATHFDATIRADDPRGRRGSEIDFDRELGLEDRDVIEFLSMAWRPRERHELGVSYFHQTLAGGRTLERDLEFRGELFEFDAAVYSALTHQSIEFHYTYWAHLDERFALGVRFGHMDYRIATRIEVMSSDSGDPLESRLRVTTRSTVPVPSIGIDFRMRLAENWRLNASAGWLEANFRYVSPRITTARVGFEYFPWEKIGFWSDIAFNRVRASYQREWRSGMIEIREGGLRLGVTYRL